MDSATYTRVLEIVDGDIRPLLKIHGGDVRVLQVAADGRVELEFEGACRGCALQTVTYAVGIRRSLLEVPGCIRCEHERRQGVADRARADRGDL
jgi:Fe-S cluster biogenesis protein NfuA